MLQLIGINVKTVFKFACLDNGPGNVTKVNGVVVDNRFALLYNVDKTPQAASL